MSNKRPQGGPQNNLSSKSAPPATHIHASSLAVPIQSNLSHLRDVILSRIDDTNPHRVELETNDSSYAPMRRARLQNRLNVRFKNKQVELRVYSQGGSGANKDSDLVNIRSLTCTTLHNDDGSYEEVESYSDDDEEEEKSRAPTKQEDPTKAVVRDEEEDVLPEEINGGANHWRQITLALGWM
jgi:hypothetical protein